MKTALFCFACAILGFLFVQLTSGCSAQQWAATKPVLQDMRELMGNVCMGNDAWEVCLEKCEAHTAREGGAR